MSYTQNIDDCYAAAIGPLGIEKDDLTAHAATLTKGIAALQAHRDEGSLPLLRLPDRDDDLSEMTAVAEDYSARLDDVVVFGTGGSSLGAEAVYALTDPAKRGSRPRLHIVSSVDPFEFSRIVRPLDLSRTGWVVVSKSGGTTETIMQFLTVLPDLRKTLGEDALKRHVTVITQPGNSALRTIAERYGLPILEHDPNVGGRYSVLSVVGMLPALFAGLDPRAVRAGAMEVLAETLDAAANPLSARPALGAALSIALNQKHGITSSVLLAYSDRLAPFTRWYRQLWAESLGKDGKGTTPIDGIGPVDQHSQVQLWLDGPNDKMFTVVGAPTDDGVAAGDLFPGIEAELAALAGADYLTGRTMADLMDASRRGTAGALAGRGKPVRRIDLAATDESSLGAVMMHFMLETILAADLLAVDAFDQPAVEDGKVLTRQFLSQPET